MSSKKKRIPDATLENVLPPNEGYAYFEHAASHPFQYQKTAFSTRNAWWLAECALLAYANPDFAEPRFKAAGFTNVEFFSGAKTGAQCYLVYNQHFIVLAFRGTQVLKQGKIPFREIVQDICTDAQIIPVPSGQGGNVHGGFKKALDDVWGKIKARLDEIDTPARTLWFTGHSLGGALATLAADRYGDVKGLYTFGAPYVGDQAFANDFHINTYRFVNNNDIVPHLLSIPPYVHVGQLKHIDSNGDLHDNPSVADTLIDGVFGWLKMMINADGMHRAGWLNSIPLDNLNDHAPLFYAVRVWNCYVEKTIAQGLKIAEIEGLQLTEIEGRKMAETTNIAKMAEQISKQIFAEFLWQRIGTTNINWPCELQDKHKSNTHPSDIVFYYDEPYKEARTYVNTDLKSYAKGSITKNSIQSAIESLARTLSCAEISTKFREQFIHEAVTPEICGLLFVYNHDGEYDKDFGKLIDQIKSEELDIPNKSKIVILGPKEIFELNNIYHEIVHMRGGLEIVPSRDCCKYFYPHLVRKKNVQAKAKAATLEMLTAPWIILDYDDKSKRNCKGFVIFYRRKGESIHEFLYLIDYLMHYQVLVDNNDVYIKMVNPSDCSHANFEKAKDQYIEEYNDGGSGIRERLNAIKFEQINHVRTSFSEIELGM